MPVLRRPAALLAGLLLASVPAAAAEPVCTPDPAANALWTVADVDGDRAAEVVRVPAATTSPSDPEVFETGCRVEATSGVARVLHGTLAVRDLDADRDLDLVHVDAAGAPVRAWLNDGRGRFRTVPAAAARGLLPRSRYEPLSPSSSPLLTAWHVARERTAGDVESPRTVERRSYVPVRVAAPVSGAISSDRRATGTRAPPRVSPALRR